MSIGGCGAGCALGEWFSIFPNNLGTCIDHNGAFILQLAEENAICLDKEARWGGIDRFSGVSGMSSRSGQPLDSG